MSRETSKCYMRRYIQGHLKFLVGNGIDIGGGDDPFLPISGTCINWDCQFGLDGEKMVDVENNKYDFLYSSHCLEHLDNHEAAFSRWVDVVKDNGYIYVAVPDFDLYEGGLRIVNAFHKRAFSMHRKNNPNIPLVNIFDFLKLYEDRIELKYIGLCDDYYDYNIPKNIDQTAGSAVCHIEFMVKKIR